MTIAKIAFWILVVVIVSFTVWLYFNIKHSKKGDTLSRSTAWIRFLQLILGMIAMIGTAVGVYYNFFTPFSPKFTVGPYSWRIRPVGSPNFPVEVALWLSASNLGATSGTIQDIVAKVSLPKGEWFLKPRFFIDSSQYLQLMMKPNDSPQMSVTELFSPIFLGGKSQVTKSILFIPSKGKADLKLLEPGIHSASFYIEFEDGSLVLLTKRKMVLELDMIEKWRKGTTIAGAQFERDKPIELKLKEKRL